MLAVGVAVAVLTASDTCASIGCGHYYDKSLPCQCNYACAKHHDCCDDYNATCGSPGPSPPYPPSPPHHYTPAPPVTPHGPSCGDSPQQFHLSVTGDPTQMVVSYVSCSTWNTPACSVAKEGTTDWKTFNGYSHTYTDGGWLGLLHTVVMTDLLADGTTRYSYKCDNSTTLSFTANPATGTFPLTVGVVADLGEDCAREGCGNATIKALGKAAQSGELQAIVHAGDIAYADGDQAKWDEYMREMEPATARVPYQVCVGNHEHHYNFSAFLNRFAMAGDGGAAGGKLDVNNLFHSYDFGPAHFVAFSTEHDLNVQLDWIRRDLQKAAAPAQRKAVPWIVMYAHKPLYCSTSDPYDCDVNGPMHIRPAIEPLLTEFGVDFFFAGHLHNYERSWPITTNGTVPAKSYNNTQGPVHMVVGNAGCDEGLTDRWETTPAWSAMHKAELGYGRLRFNSPEEAVWEMVLSETGNVLDSVTVTRTRV